ncbi:MAG TPA: hypothetical protein VF008_28990 [Niastella sp.]
MNGSQPLRIFRLTACRYAGSAYLLRKKLLDQAFLKKKASLRTVGRDVQPQCYIKHKGSIPANPF